MGSRGGRENPTQPVALEVGLNLDEERGGLNHRVNGGSEVVNHARLDQLR